MLKKFLKAFFSTIIIFSLIFAGSIMYYLNAGENSPSIKNVFNFNSSKDSINFLMMGVDSKDVSKNNKARSDTLMVFNINKNSGKIGVLSIPRDTRTKITGRKNQEKINHAHFYGGPELTLNTVSELLDIDLDYYIVTDYKFVKEFVDLIGGVDIDVPIDMKYEDPTDDPPLKIDIRSGQQNLDGDKSLQYLRYRKGYADADLGRINAQQVFIKRLVEKSLKPKNILKIPLMLKAYNNNVDTNIPLDIIIKYAMKAKRYDLSNMNTETLPGEAKTIGGTSFYIHSIEKTKKLVMELFNINKEYAAIK